MKECRDLPKVRRLLKRRVFVRLSRQGRRRQNAHFILCYEPSEAGRHRIGVTVTRRVGGAVVRNRIKRVCREYFRCNRHRMEGAWDLSVIAKKSAGGCENAVLRVALANLFKPLERIGDDENRRVGDH